MQTRAESLRTLCVLTNGRTMLLRRALAGFARNVQVHGLACRFVVFDNSTDPNLARDCRRTIQDFAREARTPIDYVGPAERARWVEQLVAMGLCEASVTFAFCGVPGAARRTGANRNVALAFLTGDLFLSLDDDEECELAPSPEHAEGVSYFSGFDPTELWFFDDREALLRSVRFAACDVVGIHNAWLGRRLRLNGDAPPALDVRFRQSLAGGEARVIATMTGIAGDCGMATPRGFWLTGPSRERLFASEESYRRAFTSREILKVASRTTISDGRFCMTGSIGLDARAMLPPFFPIGRNTDGLFGNTVRACVSDGYFAHLPWAMLHSPGAAQRFPDDVVWQNTSRLDLSRFLGAAIKASVPALLDTGAGAASDADRVRRLGERLIALGSQPGEDFERAMRDCLTRAIAQSVQWLESSVDPGCEPPAYWKRDLPRFLDALAAPLAPGGSIAPRDLPEIWPGDWPEAAADSTPLSRAQALVTRFGALLRDWPSIVEASRLLRERGQMVAG